MTSPQIELSPEIVHKRQEIVDLLPEILYVPSALVMKVEPSTSRLLESGSQNRNVCHTGP
jgi:hypothetical protein